jgi:hypothetical protein
LILVDTNVLLDVVLDDPGWAGWSMAQLGMAAARGPVLINPVVYAELSVGYSLPEYVDEFLDGAGIVVAEIPRAALFLAGKAFQTYRRRGGTRTGVLPDFFIGAHAAVVGIPLLTRDPRRHRHHFPKIALLAP